MTDQIKLAYTVVEACAAIPCSRTKLYELIATGCLDARKEGRTTVITAESLQVYCNARPKAEIRVPVMAKRAMERAKRKGVRQGAALADLGLEDASA